MLSDCNLIKQQVDEIIEKIKEIENNYTREIENVHPIYRKSALNLVHYLGFRSFDIDDLQDQLRDLRITQLFEYGVACDAKPTCHQLHSQSFTW